MEIGLRLKGLSNYVISTPNNLKVEIINPLESAEWDNQITSHPEVTFFHSFMWAKILNATYGYRPDYLVVRDCNRIKALLPVMGIDSFLTGKRGVSLPFTDFCQPILGEEVEVDDIWNVLQVHGKQQKWKYFEVRGGDGLRGKIPVFSSCYEQVLPLSENTQSVYSNFKESHKRNVKKAGKVGLEVSVDNSMEAVKKFYTLNLLTRKRHGLPPQPFSFFKNLYHVALKGGSANIFLANIDGKAVAGALCLHFCNKAIYKYGASDSQFQHLRPNNLVIWKAIEWYCQNGYEQFSFGRTDTSHTGLKKFKAGWGAHANVVNYYRYSFLGKEIVESVAKVDGWHTKIFSRMPLPLLKLIGAVLYKHVG